MNRSSPSRVFTVVSHPDGRSERAREDGPSDVELLDGIGHGSEEAFTLFFDRWAPRLGRFLARSTGSRETAEDLLHEVFLRVLRSAHRFEPRGSVAAWLYRIASNAACSEGRRRRASRAVLEESCRGDGAVIDAAGSPETECMTSLFAREARSALRRIPESQRAVFRLKVEEGLTYADIAAVLECPVGTAKSRFHHAVRQLRALLKDWDEGASPGR